MQVVEGLTPVELQRCWQAVTEDEGLADFQGRAELDAYGEVVLTPPPSFIHQRIANDLADQLQSQLGGSAIVECPVMVDGVLIADAAWLSGARAAAIASPAAEHPEIVLEVMSPRNTKKGMRSKAARCLAHGVEEVIIVDLDGTISFITSSGEKATSRFGLQLTLPPNSYPLQRATEISLRVSEEVVESFGKALRRKIVEGDTGFAKGYLSTLVDEIVASW